MTQEEKIEAKRIANAKWVENNKEYNKNYYLKNKEGLKIKTKQYKSDNKEEIKTKNKEYYINNKIEILDKQNIIYLNRDKNSFNKIRRQYYYKNLQIMVWRRILKSSLNRLGKTKEGHTIDLLGYSALELKQHLETLFTDGMTWDNYGEWHVDHIKDVVLFDKQTPVNIVNALSNLQPLWATTREINGVIYEGNLNKEKKFKRLQITS